MTAMSSGRIAPVFVELADTLIDDFDLIEFLELVTTRICELTGATAAGILLADRHGRLNFMAASDERMQNLELFQLQLDEGPCRDCFHTGTAVGAADLAQTAARWPSFSPRAVAAGLRSVHAFPMRLRQQTIGSIGLFSATPGDLEPSTMEVVQALADVATIGLLQERGLRQSEALAQQLQQALDSRIVVEQAKGVAAQQLGLTVADAFDMLRTYCRARGLRMGDVCADIVRLRARSPHLARLRAAAREH